MARTLPRYTPRAQSQLQLEAGVGIFEARSEQLTQLCEPIAHRLRVDVERLRDGLGPAPVAEPGVQRRPESLAGQFGLCSERCKSGVGDITGEAPVGAQEQRQLVALGDEQRVIAVYASSGPSAARP